jgi:hypothetical protein
MATATSNAAPCWTSAATPGFSFMSMIRICEKVLADSQESSQASYRHDKCLAF